VRTGYVQLQNSEMVHQADAKSVGRPNLSEAAEVILVARGPSSSPDLEADVHSLSSSRASDRRYVTRAEFSDNYGADPGDLERIEAFANNHGLTVAAVSPAQRVVRLVGTLADLAKAFDVQFAIYRSSLGSYRGYAGSIHVPAELSPLVTGVFGLSNRQIARPQFQKPATSRGRVGVRPTAAGITQTYTPDEVAKLYNFPAELTGEGQCIGILEFGGGFKQVDLNAYFKSLGISVPNVVAVSVGGAYNRPVPGPNSPDDEVNLDIEVVGAIAPLARIVVYFAPNTTAGWIRAVNAAIHDSYHKPSVISISWGGNENTWSRAAIHVLNHQFMVAAALGITVCAAAGDQGFRGPGESGPKANVFFPASSPYVLACGGTRLDSLGGKISAETVWNDGPTSATGGGVSAVFPVPSWQRDASVPPSVNSPHLPGRGVPDVAGNADPNTGYRIRSDGQDFAIGGTSAVAPLWAALVALINQKLGTPIGFVSPLLYSQGVTGFNDVLTGNNGTGGYSAGPGWDACTGWGSPDGSTLCDLL
jgi:kumamolisin